jgi:hypothetical protein
MGNFAIDIRQWKTVEAFEAHLAAHNPNVAPWAQGVTVHHTWKPTPAQWRGRASIEGLKTFYEHKDPPWDAGPHLFIVHGSPNPNDDGIWQMTPLNMTGIHAGAICNSTTWGIEVVGDYDVLPWSLQTRHLVVGAIAALFKWRKLVITPNTLKGHRDCHSPKSCPGNAIDMAKVRQWVMDDMSTDILPTVTTQSQIVAHARCTQPQAGSYILSRQPTPAYTSSDIALIILPAYWSVAVQCGIDPCVVIAQMIHETANMSSWWSQRPRRNPAGIGVTGETRTDAPPPDDAANWAYNENTKRWHKGLSFPSWKDSIPAHVGRLAAYAIPVSERTSAQQDIINQALAYRPLPDRLHGCAPTLEGLNGTWAFPGTNYANRLASIANEMINH